jgi:hypothetical protein
MHLNSGAGANNGHAQKNKAPTGGYRQGSENGWMVFAAFRKSAFRDGSETLKVWFSPSAQSNLCLSAARRVLPIGLVEDVMNLPIRHDTNPHGNSRAGR